MQRFVVNAPKESDINFTFSFFLYRLLNGLIETCTLQITETLRCESTISTFVLIPKQYLEHTANLKYSIVISAGEQLVPKCIPM
jgi:hypothetical protein